VRCGEAAAHGERRAAFSLEGRVRLLERGAYEGRDAFQEHDGLQVIDEPCEEAHGDWPV